jgi:hypothetical protein
VRPYATRRTLFVASLLFAALALGACRDPKVVSYRVPKDAVGEQPAGMATAQPAADASRVPSMGAMPAAMPPMSGAQPGVDPHGMATAQGGSLEWTAPAGWEKKNSSSMRKATYVIGSGDAAAELAISAFPGDVGGEIANVNRWRGQIGLSPVSDAEATGAIARTEANGLKVGCVDLVNPENATRMIGAWIPFEGATWFFKLVGPDAVFAKEKPAFIEFLKTIKPAAPTP